MTIAFLVYGDLSGKSGGYEYDRRMVEQLLSRGDVVDTVGLTEAPLLVAPLVGLDARLKSLFSGAAGYDWVVVDELVHPVTAHATKRWRTPSSRIALLVHHLSASEDLWEPARRLHRRWEKLLVRSVDLIIANSETTAESVRSFSPRAPIAVCPPGVERPSPTSMPGSGEHDGTVRLLTTGNVIPRKGFTDLVQVLALLRDLPFTLTITGDDKADAAYAAKLARLVRRLDLEDRVTVTGYVSEAELTRQYEWADVFVLASRYEGYGISLAEALMYGLPFVAFDVGAVREVATSAVLVEREQPSRSFLEQLARGHGGFVVPRACESAFAACLSLLIQDRVVRRSMAAQAAMDGRELPDWTEAGRRFYAALHTA
jgi:glycosyltransferase involved in cell wall biosynthesis